MVNGLLQDLRFAVRQLARNRGFTAVSVLVLGLGMGANVAMFSFTNALLLRPPQGVSAPDGLFQLIARSRPQDDFRLTFAFPDFDELQRALEGEVALAAHDSTQLSVRVGEVTERLEGSLVDGTYFGILGVGAQRGRVLSPNDDVPGKGAVAVVSHEFWENRLGSDEGVVGRDIAVNGQSFTVVGVAERGFSGVERFEKSHLWVPLAMEPSISSVVLRRRPGVNRISVLGRPLGGLSQEAVRERVETLGAALAERHANPDAPRELSTMPGLGFGPAEKRTARLLSGVLLAVASLVLLIACANVANLVLARASRRRSEVALRRALGASRPRVARLLLTESLVLSLLAAALGTFIAFLGKDMIPALLPQFDSDAGFDLILDHRVVLYTGILAAASALTFGMAPVLSSRGLRLASELTEGGQRGGRARAGLRSALVVVQLALSVVLLMAAGLLLETMRRLQAVDPGFSGEQVLATSIDPGLQSYTESQIAILYERLPPALEAMPGTVRATLADTIPLSGGADEFGGLTIEGSDPPEGSTGWTVQVNIVASGFFETLDIPRSEGRDFAATDTASAPPVVIVSEAFRQRYWPDRALGRTIGIPRQGEEPLLVEVVGVVGDVHYGSLAETIQPVLYLPLSQNLKRRMSILVRGEGDPLASVGPVRDAVHVFDADMPLFGIAPVDQIVESSLWQERLFATLLTLFGALALILAAVGLYGVVAYIVSESRREIGIRIAVGASGFEVVTHFLKGSLRLVLTALALGIGGSLATGQLLSGTLHGVRALEPGVTFGVLGVMLTIAGLATVLPARAATKVNPVEALRSDG